MIVISLYGRHRRKDHKRLLSNYKIINFDKNISVLDFYFIFNTFNKLKFQDSFLFLLLIIISFLERLGLEVKIICSDHFLVRRLKNTNSYVTRDFILSRLMNVFYNDWREMEEYCEFSNVCFLGGGNDCLEQDSRFRVFPVFPAFNLKRNYETRFTDRIFYVGKAHFDVKKLLTTHDKPLSSAADKLVKEISKKEFEQNSYKDSMDFFPEIRQLNLQSERLLLVSFLRNKIRTSFFKQLALSPLRKYTFVIGDELVENFNFIGQKNNYNYKEVFNYMASAKINLDLGSQLLLGSFYSRSCDILETSPYSLVQMEQKNAKAKYGIWYKNLTFDSFKSFEELCEERFSTHSDDFQQKNLLIRKEIENNLLE